MIEFTYTIKDPLGIHARPAGMLAKEAKALGDTVVTISRDGNTVKASQLMKVMSMGIKCGHTLTIGIEGGDEAAAAEKMKAFFNENL